MNLRVLPYGDRALLLEPEDPADVLPLTAALRAQPDVLEVVPAARTVLVRASDLGRLRGRLDDVDHVVRAAGRGGRDFAAAGSANPIVLAVRYDGPDLGGTAARFRSADHQEIRQCPAE